MLFCVIKLPCITFDWWISCFRFSIPSERLRHLTCNNWTCSSKLVEYISESFELIKKYLSFKIWMLFSIHVMASATKPSLCYVYAVFSVRWLTKASKLLQIIQLNSLSKCFEFTSQFFLLTDLILVLKYLISSDHMTPKAYSVC